MYIPEEITILIVDDNYINQRLAVLTLKQMNLRCDVASDGKQAFEMFQQTPYDIVLMDLRMPVMDGLESAKLIRKFEKESGALRNALILALSANELSANEDQYLEAGMDGFMEKPISAGLLAGYISKLSGKPKSKVVSVVD